MRMRHAYGTMDWANTQILFGQTQDIFGPAIASTQDFRSGAATGTPNNPRVPQLRLTQKVPFNKDNSLKLVVGIQDPGQMGNAYPNGSTQFEAAGSYSSKPNIAGQAMFLSTALGKAPGYFGLAMNPLTVGVFGLYGSEQIGANSHVVDSYGYGAYAFVPVLKSKDGKSRAMTLSLEAQGYFAANMKFNSATGNTTLNSTLATPLFPAGSNTNPAKGYGLYGQAIFFPTQDLGITGGYGRRDAYSNASFAGVANYERTNELIYGNVSYDLNAAVRVAVEYEHQKTLYGNVANGTGNLAGLSDFGQDNTIRLCAYYFF